MPDDNKISSGAQSKALELAEYVTDIQKEIDRVAYENQELRNQYFGNLEDRYDKVFAKTNKLFMMSMFAQWKMCAANSQFAKELQEAEGTFKDEKTGYEEHVKALEESYAVIHQRNVENRTTILSQKMVAEDLQKKVLEMKRKTDGYKEQLATNTAFINGVKIKLDAYKPRFMPESVRVQNQKLKDASTNIELEMMKREMHFILSRIDPYYVRPLQEPNVPTSLQIGSGDNFSKTNPADYTNANA